MLSRCFGSWVSRASFRSIRQSVTCAGLTLVPSVSDQRFATASKTSTGSPYSRRRRFTMAAACSRSCSALTVQLPDQATLGGMQRVARLAAIDLLYAGPGADHRLGRGQGRDLVAAQ